MVGSDIVAQRKVSGTKLPTENPRKTLSSGEIRNLKEIRVDDDGSRIGWINLDGLRTVVIGNVEEQELCARYQVLVEVVIIGKDDVCDKACVHIRGSDNMRGNSREHDCSDVLAPAGGSWDGCREHEVGRHRQ